MQALLTFWRSGIVGKAVLSLAGLLLFTVCGCVGLFMLVPSSSRSSTAQSATAAPQGQSGAIAEPLASKPSNATAITVAAATTAPTSKPTAAAPPTATPEPTATLEPTATPEPTATLEPTPIPVAPVFTEIRDVMRAATDAQWSAYQDILKGQQAQNWSGYVVEVNKKFLGGYEVWVDMDEPGSISVQDVTFDIPDELALKLNKGQVVTFSGTITSVFNVLGSCSVNLEDGIIQQ